ncbi:MAG: PEP-CTERM sorting domain-containing protein [Crocosphaera sp.]
MTPGNGVITGNEFINEGLTIVHRDNQPINVVSLATNDELFVNNINSSPNVISSVVFVGGGFNDSFSENYDFILTNPSSAAGLYLGNIGSGSNSPTQVQFLNGNGDVIAEEIFTVNNPNLIGTGPNNRVFYGITSSEAIAIIRTIEPANDGDVIVYDDVQFATNTQSVPESSNILGIGFMGLLGMFLTLKKRK